MRSQAFSAWVILILSLAIVGGSGSIVAQTEDGGLLAYSISYTNKGTHLMIYDPTTNKSTLLYASDERLWNFFFSNDGRIAWASWIEGESKILILDIHTPDQPPMNLSQILGLSGYPLGWSRDGRYLAFVVPENPNGDSIYVWDGETAINITPDETIGIPEVSEYGIAWSYDNRLAFTLMFDTSADLDELEIYLWDGNTTTNLSQNPTGRDNDPIWNTHNEIIFSSIRDGEHGIFLWDGVSIEDGLPDVTSFVNITPDMRVCSNPSWANDGRWLYLCCLSLGENIRIYYAWDGEVATIIKIIINQYPDFSIYTPRWNVNGRYLAFSTYLSNPQLLYIYDLDNNTVLTRKGIYPPDWSSEDNLLFCDLENRGLSIWDGQEFIQIVSGWEIWAQWQNGSHVFCSNG